MLFGSYTFDRPFEDIAIDTGCSKSVTDLPVDFKLPGPSLRVQFALWKACFVESVTLIVETVTLIVPL